MIPFGNDGVDTEMPLSIGRIRRVDLCEIFPAANHLAGLVPFKCEIIVQQLGDSMEVIAFHRLPEGFHDLLGIHLKLL